MRAGKRNLGSIITDAVVQGSQCRSILLCLEHITISQMFSWMFPLYIINLEHAFLYVLRIR